MELFNVPSDTVIAYTAGIIDGEGSIFISETSVRHGCSVSQSEKHDGEELCRWLKSEWEIGTVSGESRKACRRRYGKFKRKDGKFYRQWYWSVCAVRELQSLLQLCLPYLHVKKSKAEKLLRKLRKRVASCPRFKFSNKEDDFIKRNCEKEDSEIAVLLGRTTASVRHRRQAIRVKKGYGWKPYGWRTREDKYIRKNLHKTDREIGLYLGRTKRSVRARRDRIGVKRRV